MKTLESIVYVISQLIFLGRELPEEGRRRNIAETFAKTLGTILGVQNFTKTACNTT